MTIVVNSSDFLVVEQINPSRYIAHVFCDREQFVAWRQDHQWMTILDPRSARGRMVDTQDHRYEYEYL
jgi:hypothetical protein